LINHNRLFFSYSTVIAINLSYSFTVYNFLKQSWGLRLCLNFNTSILSGLQNIYKNLSKNNPFFAASWNLIAMMQECFEAIHCFIERTLSFFTDIPWLQWYSLAFSLAVAKIFSLNNTSHVNPTWAKNNLVENGQTRRFWILNQSEFRISQAEFVKFTGKFSVCPFSIIYFSHWKILNP